MQNVPLVNDIDVPAEKAVPVNLFVLLKVDFKKEEDKSKDDKQVIHLVTEGC